MNAFATLLAAQPIVFLHLACALGALGLGSIILARRKGSATHRRMGRAWVALMAGAALSSAFLRGGGLPHLGGFSPIHALTLLVLWLLPRGIRFARQGDLVAHRKTMRGLYLGGCVVAGLFTLMPGRFLGEWLWARTLGLAT